MMTETTYYERNMRPAKAKPTEADSVEVARLTVDVIALKSEVARLKARVIQLEMQANGKAKPPAKRKAAGAPKGKGKQ
jgi:hypothetical protein